MPIEEMARRGQSHPRVRPDAPCGAADPRSDRHPFAVVQFRQDDRQGRLFNMVGFQTKMTYPEQRRVLRMIPGLEQRGIRPPRLAPSQHFYRFAPPAPSTLQLPTRDDLLLAGQMVGVEGYVESAAAGLLAAINAARIVAGSGLITAA